MAVLLGVGLLTVALGYLVGIVPVVIGLFLLGFANGAWDVAMNVQGASVEQHLGPVHHVPVSRRVQPGYRRRGGHRRRDGLASVSVTVHLLVVAIGTAVVVPLAVRGFLPDLDQDTDHAAEETDKVSVFRRWREPRTLLIGVFVFAFAFAEGTGNDWIAVSLIDGYQASAAAGTVGFAVFLTAMTAGRWFGPNLLDRYGRVTVVRTLAVVATGGLCCSSSARAPRSRSSDRALGRRHLTRLPGRDERRRRRPGCRRRPGQRGSLHRVLRVPGRAAADRVPRRERQRAQGPHRRRRTARGGRAGGRRTAPVVPCRSACSRGDGGRPGELTGRHAAGASISRSPRMSPSAPQSNLHPPRRRTSRYR